MVLVLTFGFFCDIILTKQGKELFFGLFLLREHVLFDGGRVPFYLRRVLIYLRMYSATYAFILI